MEFKSCSLLPYLSLAPIVPNIVVRARYHYIGYTIGARDKAEVGVRGKDDRIVITSPGLPFT